MQTNDMPGRLTMRRLPNGVWRVVERARTDPSPTIPQPGRAEAPGDVQTPREAR